jgi:glycosyltransferase involved in cell wall biosynthesis
VELFIVASEADAAVLRVRYPHVAVHPFAPAFPRRWFRGSGLHAALRAAAPRLDLIHAHMIWDHPVYVASRVAGQFNIPLIISPHGSVSDPWRYRSIHKRVYTASVLRRILRVSSAVHALTRAEALACRTFGIGRPIFVTPNALPAEIAQYPVERPHDCEHWPPLQGRRVLLYLGRIWREKGLDDLVRAWSDVTRGGPHSDWVLAIAGPDYRGYRKVLQALAASLEVSRTVCMLEPVFGDDKLDLLSAADCFVLPSYSEGFSVALLEAAGMGLPCVYTEACNFPDLANAGGGWMLPTGSRPLRQRLDAVLSLSPSILSDIGASARKHVLENYSVESLRTGLLAAYHNAIRDTRKLAGTESLAC